ncbi:hypothetical protein N7456_012662 [Penicillium angulare]|uniref:DAGKc domain-containing protein n=1 Tax=Penicillium angulare TaxID=116970 RepID=A0A9W9JVR7_9EURO|nr:hypothetical protein N7456_012662 [Penicillium angulare]
MVTAPFEWGTEAFTPEVTGDILQCTSQSGLQGQINLSDILGVLPGEDSSSSHTVLFLVKPEGHNHGDSIAAVGHLEKTVISCLPSSLTQFLVKVPEYLQHSEPVQVVVSVKSGTCQAQTIFQDLVEPLLTQLSVKYEVHETKSTQTITELCESRFLERARAGTPQTIVLLSGDGGVVNIVDYFYRHTQSVQTPPHIALIPCGTGNALACSIGSRTGPSSGLKSLIRGTPTPIPIFATKLSPGSQMIVDEGRQKVPLGDPNASHQTLYGSVTVSWGIHAALVADSDTTEYRKFGNERFKIAGMKLLHPPDGSAPHKFKGNVTYSERDDQTGEVSEKTFEGDEHMYLLASLVSRLEYNFVVSPKSEPLDGSMWFMGWGPMSGEEATRLVVLAYKGGLHVDDEAVTYAKFEKLRIDFKEDSEHWRRICVDGNIIAVEKDGWLELTKEPRQLLNVIKPH